MTEIDELTDAFDVLEKQFPGYESRAQQIEMAEEVLACLKNKKRLLVEAGTGVGKSFAYLIPAILSNNKTVVSTASIALQDQLVNKDLVALHEVLPQEFSYGLLKGKNNYLCLKREREFSDLGEAYKKFREWASTTETGDKDEISFMPDFWKKVCGDSDDCNSAQCPFYGSCFYYSHFRDIRKKDILVINHHLLIYDLLSGFNLLPFHEQLIIDEAHQLENVISQAFGTTLSHSKLQWLLYRLKGMKIAVDHILAQGEAFFKIPLNLSFERGALKRNNAVTPIPGDVVEELKRLKGQLALERVVLRLGSYRESVSDDELKDRIGTTINYIGSLQGVINDFIEQDDSDKVYFLAGGKGGIELRSNLVESQRPFGELVGGYEGLIMTSATLTAGGNFSFLKGRLGISPRAELSEIRELGSGSAGSEPQAIFEEKVIGSPFDYKRQALLYVEKELPPPNGENSDSFYEESVKTIGRLINASKGRALVLFTSYSHLRFVSDNLRIDYPSKTQGDMPPAKLIEWFRKTPHSVLLATATFWQGIDVKGEQLSLVIIAKMPFGSPGDPVYDERCRRLGERWFKDLALPSAILMLRQGFGRLIRGVEDYGVVAVLDARLVASSYGGNILSSLPGMNIVHGIEDVKRFFHDKSRGPGNA